MRRGAFSVLSSSSTFQVHSCLRLYAQKTSPSCKNSRTEHPSVRSFHRGKRYVSIFLPLFLSPSLVWAHDKKRQLQNKDKSRLSCLPSSHPSLVVVHIHQSQPPLSRKTTNGLSSCRNKKKVKAKAQGHQPRGRYNRERERGEGRREPYVLGLHKAVKNNKMCSHSRSRLRPAVFLLSFILSQRSTLISFGSGRIHIFCFISFQVACSVHAVSDSPVLIILAPTHGVELVKDVIRSLH